MLRRVLLAMVVTAGIAGCGGSSPSDLTEKGLHEWRSGQYDQSIATCSEAIRLDPKNSEAYLHRGRAYQLRNAPGDTERAIADFGEAMRLAPESPDAYYYRAVVYRDLGKPELAEADEHKARELDDLVQEVYRGLPDLTPKAELLRARPDVTKQVAEEDAQQAAEQEQPPQTAAEMLKAKSEARGGAGRRRDAETFGERFDRRAQEMAEREAASARADEDDLLGGAATGAGDSGASGATLDDEPLWGSVRPITPPSGLGPSSTSSNSRSTVDRSQIPSLQSPFGRRTPAPTGYVPGNPFAPSPPEGSSLGQQQAGQQPLVQPSLVAPPRVVAPTTKAPSYNRYSNPAVRPANPRDYVR